MSQVGIVKTLEGGVFYAKDSSGNIRELSIGDIISENEIVFGDSSNSPSAKAEVELSENDVIVLNQAQQQLIDASLNEVTFGNEEVTFAKNDVQNAWNNTADDVSDDMETAAGDPTQQETQAGQEEPTEEGRVSARFSSRDGDSTNVVSDLRDASWTEEQTTIIPDLENKLIEQPLPVAFTIIDENIEQPLPVAFTIIDGDNVVWEGNTATYTVKVVDAAGNPIIVNQDTIVYVRYTNIETDDNDTQYTHNTTIEVVIKAGTSQATFTVQTKDDYLADNDERFNLEITGNNSTEFDMRTGNQTGGQTNVDTTILDNSDPLNPGGETGGYGPEDTVYVKISTPSETTEGGKLSHTVTLVDKDGNVVTIPAGEKIIVTLTYTSTDGVTDGDFSTIVKEVELISNGTTFENTTIVDNTYEGTENYTVTITGVAQTNGTYENVAIHQTENSTTGKIIDNPVEIVLVATDSTGTIPLKADGTVDLEANKNSTPEGGKLYYVAVAVDTNGKPLEQQTGTVDVSYDNTSDTTDKDATLSGTGKDIKNNPTVVEIGKTFTVDAKDDYYAEGDEKFNVIISNPQDTGYDTGVTVKDGADTVTSTIQDNPADSMKPDTGTGTDDPTDGNYGKDDTVYVKISQPSETVEGGKLSHTVTLVDKDGNVVTIPAGEKIIVTLTYTSTDGVTDGDFSTIVKEVELISNGTTFENTTIVDNTYEGTENYTVTITGVAQTNGTYENVAIHQTENSTTGKIIDNPVEIVLVATDSAGTIPLKADGTVDLEANKNSTPEGGKLYYVAVAVDTNGKPLEQQTGTVDVSYDNTSDTTDKDATLSGTGKDIKNNPTVVEIGKTFTVDAEDDYYAEGDEKFNVIISNPKDTGYDTGVSVKSGADTVTSTIQDNPADSMKPDTGTGTDDPTNPNYGKEDTVYVRIVQDSKTIEGGNLNHKIQLVDKDGNPVEIPDGEKITVKLQYTPLDGTKVNDDDFVNIREVEVTLDNSVKENGYYKIQIQNQTKVDFDKEGTEKYQLEITNVEQSNGTFENVAISQTENKVTGTILDGITFKKPEDAYVDEDNFYQNDLNGTDGGNVTKSNLTASKSLGINIPDGYENTVGTYTINFVGNPTLDGVTKLTSDGKDVHFQTIGNKIIAYIGTDVGNSAVNQNNKVFEIVLNKSTGKYDYTQYKNIDHPKAGEVSTKEGLEQHNTLDDIVLNFEFKITTKDSEGKVIGESGNQPFNVTVNDSTPIAGEKTLTIYEDNNGQTNGAYTFVLSDEGFQKDPTDPSTKGQIEIDNGNGVYKTIAKDGTVDIYDENEIVGTLKNNGNGTLTFTPNKDYSKYEADNGYLPNFKYKVYDTDGDYAKGTIKIQVKPVADAPTIFVKNIETTEDAGNTQEGTNKVDLGLKTPLLSKDSQEIKQTTPTDYSAINKDNNQAKYNEISAPDKNDTATGDHSERNGEITLQFTNGKSVIGAELYSGDTKVATISSNNQLVTVVIVKTSGGTDIDTAYHHNGILPAKGGNVLYLMKEEYESLKIQHAEDNDTDIKITIKVTSYEVDDSGKPLNASDSTYSDKTNSNLSKTTTASMIVLIKPVTDDIELKFDNAIVNGETLGTISDDKKTFTYKNIDEGNKAIDLQALLSKTSGALFGKDGTKGDLDGSEKRTYIISDIPLGTVITLDSKTFEVKLNADGTLPSNITKNANGLYTITIPFPDNTKEDPNFSMEFDENFSGTVNAKITLSVQDKGVEIDKDGKKYQADQTDYGFKDANGKPLLGVKQAEVNFKVNVYPVADEATLKVGQAVGYEDAGRSQGNISNGSDASKVDEPEKGISLDIKVSSTDTDGSETITININKIPSGGYIYYKGGLYDENRFVSGTKTDGVISTKSGDTWTITVPKYNNESPKFIPPHNSDEEYSLEVTAQTVDTAMIEGTEVIKIKESDVSTPKIIEVIVKGVADVPVGTELNSEDGKAYTVGENDLDRSGNKFDLKVIYEDSSKLDSYDHDGSEELSIVIKDLPAGFGVEGALPTGDGEWAFNAKDLDKIKITTPSNFSGEASFTLTYVTTEREGNSKVHYDQVVNIYVNPEIDSTLNGQSVGNEDAKIDVNLNIVHNNGDTDETLEEVKINVNDVTSKDFTLYINGVDIKDAGLTIEDGYYELTPAQAKTITAQGKENVSGEYEFDVKYTVKDVANDGAEIKEFDTTHKLVINPVTDQPTIDFGTIEVTGSNITVNGTDIKIVGDKKSTIEIPVETTSPDTDGSEKVVEIRIEGVPAGVKVEGGESSEEALKISQNNGVWTIKVDETITDINDIIKNIKFEIDSDAKFSHREITITTVTQDKDAKTEEKHKTITIDHDKAPGTGGGTGEAANFSLVAKDFIVTEDKEFRLTNLFDIKTNGREVEGTSWTITLTDLPEGTIINGTVIGADGKYVIESKLDGQDIYDIESIISNIKITPPANLNDYDNSTKSMTITATIETKVGQTVISTSEVENDSTILPVTDKMTVTVDAVNEIDESGSFEFGITLSSTGDNESRTDIVGETIVIIVSENFESGETATGELLYNGQVLTPNTNGQYEIEVPTGYKFGDKIEGLEYKSGEQRHGNVTITASIKHQETEAHDNYETNVENASGSATVNVKPVLDANPDDIKITANSVEDTIIDVKIEDTQFITDNSENLINVIFNDIPKDFIVYYKDANGNTKMAVNTGDGKWLVPVVNGNLPDGIQIKAPENYSGEFKFNMDFYIKEEGLDLQKITKEATVNVTPIADGVTIDPTLSGIQDDGSYAKAFEWTDLNLNANMKDVDGSETLTLKFDGLSQNAQFRILAEDGTAKSVDALYENGEWTINGINVDDINNIQLLHDKEATVKVTASTVDTAIDENGNPVGSSSTSTEVESTFDLRIDSSDIDNGKFTLGKEVNIDFSKIENGDIKDINTIDLGAEGKNELLNLTLQDVLDIGEKDGDGNINLTILGDDKDGVSFAKNDGWQKSEITQTIGDKTFEVWSNTGDNTVTVKVEQPISDGITN